MKAYRRILSLALALAILLGSACAHALDVRWTLGNFRTTIGDEEFIIAPDAELQILQDDERLLLNFGVNLNGRTLLPVAADISAEGVHFSLGSRVYTLDIQSIIDDLVGLTEDEKTMISHLGELFERASVLMGRNTGAYMQENDAIINRMYEILVGRNAEATEITVNGQTLPARKYTGDIKGVHFVDLLEYMRKCENEDIALFTNSVLQLMNVVTGEEYEYFSDFYHDGYFGDPLNSESIMDAEIIIGYNDDLVYEKLTYTVAEPEDEEENSDDSDGVVSQAPAGKTIMMQESITTGSGMVISSTETYTDEDNHYASHTAIEIDGSITAPTAIRMKIESDEGYTRENEAAELTITMRDVIGFSFDAKAQDGLWNASLTGSQDTATAYDYGDGPVVLNDEYDVTASYTETRGNDGRITGLFSLNDVTDGKAESISFEIGRGEGAEIAHLAGEGVQTFILDADTDGMGYKLLSADAMAMAASAAELYADPGIFGLMSYLNAEGPGWPDELSDDIYNRYNRSYYYGRWEVVYSFADAARVFEGNMPRYSEPENSVLTGIQAGARNLQMDYASNDGDFQIEIAYLSDEVAVPTPPVPVTVEDFTFVEEDGMLMAYFCDGEYLVFIDFEHPDRARAEEIIAGLMLASKKVGLSA